MAPIFDSGGAFFVDKAKPRSKKDYYKLNRKYNSLINLFQDSESVKKDIIQDLRNQIQNLNTEVTTLRVENVEIKERLDKIDLRDTIKMSFKYLYNILRTKFNTEPEANNFWGQTQQIKKILSTIINYKCIK